MRNLSTAEKELLLFIGKELFDLMRRAYEVAKDKNIDLDSLMDEARKRNDISLKDLIEGEDNG